MEQNGPNLEAKRKEVFATFEHLQRQFGSFRPYPEGTRRARNLNLNRP